MEFKKRNGKKKKRQVVKNGAYKRDESNRNKFKQLNNSLNTNSLLQSND